MAIGRTKSEFEKKELSLKLNDYRKPKIYENVEAWTQLIIQLAYMEPGTIPSNPTIGCDFSKYIYIDEAFARNEIVGILEQQVRLFYPDIPLDKIIITFKEYEGLKVAVFIVRFIDTFLNTTTTVAATSIGSNGLLNVKINF